MSRIVRTSFWDGLWLLAIASVIFSAMMFGCSTPKPTGWHPASEKEMKMLIGQTVMEAIHQYQTQLWKNGVQVPKAGSRMNQGTQPASMLSPGQSNEDNEV